MTRAKKEQVQIALHDAVGLMTLALQDDHDVWGRITSALAILDAELAKPEAREWGTRYIDSDATDGDLSGGYARTGEQARKLVLESPRQWALVWRVAASSTPAGPWEPAK